MLVYGYAKDHYYAEDSTLMIRVRVPSIHGPYAQTDGSGKTLRNYTADDALPYYQSILLPRMPKEGDVVVLANTGNSDRNTDFVVIGMTGTSYTSGKQL